MLVGIVLDITVASKVVNALVAVQVPLDDPPFDPPQVQVVVPPCAGKAGEAGVVTPLPAEHIVPLKADALYA